MATERTVYRVSAKFFWHGYNHKEWTVSSLDKAAKLIKGLRTNRLNWKEIRVVKVLEIIP